MESRLSHRGTGQLTHIVQPTATIAFKPKFEPAVNATLGCGAFQSNGRAIALAGQLTHPRPTASTLEDLLQSYHRQGPAALDNLRGSFVLALMDNDTLILARDGAGVRTIYYAVNNGRFLFAIEPKGITADPSFPRRIRPGAVAQYLTFSFIPGADTMLEGLFELPPGHRVTFSPKQGTNQQRYFFFETPEPHPPDNDEHWTQTFDRAFSDAVDERLPKGESVGIFLSGGIDSSIVASAVAERHRHPVKSYAIHFGPNYTHELDFARAVADRCGTEHHEIQIIPKHFLKRLRQMVWHLDDPIGDPVTLPNFELSRIVANDVRWVFNGEGGDPCFGGPKNTPMLLQHWYGGVQRESNFREVSYLASYRRAYDELERLLTPEWKAKIDHEQDLVGVIKPFFDARVPKGFLEKLLTINIRLKGAHLILPKVDRMTGAWGITPLSPLFDERMLELAFRMPGRMKLDHGIEKVALKRAFAHRLPAEIIARPKSGMRVPVHFWFKGELKRYARKILSPRAIKKAGIFDPQRVKQLLAYDIAEGRGRYGLRLWMLITFEIWRRMVIEGESL
jgi:asparagine synthase (glutamine-hydrolysing)